MGGTLFGIRVLQLKLAVFEGKYVFISNNYHGKVEELLFLIIYNF